MKTHMLKKTALFILLSGLPIRASAAEYQTMAFPPAHELFAPLQADPTELRFAFHGGAPVHKRAIARVDVGDYLGLYRWAFPSGLGAAQLNIGGAIFTRFEATSQHSLQVIDYYGNVPLDVRLGPVSGRFLFYHDSSHLGDDYLRERNIQSGDNAWEALRGILSIQPVEALRLYGGYQQSIHNSPNWRGKESFQGGVEIYFITPDHVFLHPYWANDVQTWHRSGWKPTWTSQLGVKTGSATSRGRGISYFLQCQTGPRSEGQFFTQEETVWSVGLKFQLSQAPLNPAAPPEPPLMNTTGEPTPSPVH
jgi:hypothetical protein